MKWLYNFIWNMRYQRPTDNRQLTALCFFSLLLNTCCCHYGYFKGRLWGDYTHTHTHTRLFSTLTCTSVHLMWMNCYFLRCKVIKWFLKLCFGWIALLTIEWGFIWGGCNKGFSWEKRWKRYTAEEPRGCGGPVATGVLHSPLTVAPVTWWLLNSTKWMKTFSWGLSLSWLIF